MTMMEKSITRQRTRRCQSSVLVLMSAFGLIVLASMMSTAVVAFSCLHKQRHHGFPFLSSPRSNRQYTKLAKPVSMTKADNEPASSSSSSIALSLLEDESAPESLAETCGRSSSNETRVDASSTVQILSKSLTEKDEDDDTILLSMAPKSKRAERRNRKKHKTLHQQKPTEQQDTKATVLSIAEISPASSDAVSKLSNHDKTDRVADAKATPGSTSEAPESDASIRQDSALAANEETTEVIQESRTDSTAKDTEALATPEMSSVEAPEKSATDETAPAATEETTAVKDTLATTAVVTPSKPKKQPIKDVKVEVVPPVAFNVVLTHATADFDSLASAVGLAKLWTAQEGHDASTTNSDKNFKSASHVPTFVVLPRGAHPGVQRFLALHKHLFPIRSLKSLPNDLSGLNRLALVDAQRRDRLGPADSLLEHANRIVVVDHHVDQDSDIPATDYVVDKVGSVSTLISEYLRSESIELTEVEATLLALGIHADTGSLCFDSTTPRDATALAWCLEQGASQTAIAEHAHTYLSREQQNVLTQALINVNSTTVHGITLSTVLLSADGFINGLAAVTQDALELSSSDVFLMGMVYEASSGGRKKTRQNSGQLLTSRLLKKRKESAGPGNSEAQDVLSLAYKDAWRGGKDALRRRQLRSAFDRRDVDNSGYLEMDEIAAALASYGIIASEDGLADLMEAMDADGNGKVDFEEFVEFATRAEALHDRQPEGKKGSTTLILVGRVKAGVSLKAVKLNKLLDRFGGGGHPKAASATVRLNEEGEAADIMQGLVDELIHTSLQEQPTVADFMTAPSLSVKSDMNENQVEALFTRYDVRALPVVDDDHNVVGLVTYKEVASAKQRLWNKEQKRIRREKEAEARGDKISDQEKKTVQERRGSGTTVKAWMKQHVSVVEASKTMAEVEIILLENDVGCIPVVQDGTNRLVGMVTRTDLLRQHRYYASLHYHNPGFADSIEKRQPIIALRKKLKKFDDL